MDISKLVGILPTKVFNALTPEFLTKATIDGKLRLSHFIGQSMEESENYTAETENLNYSGEALWKMFHTHFKDEAEALTFARQPEKIANRVYANRNGNGTEESGDGWKYRGRGYLQITGKANYQAFQNWVNKGSTTQVDFINHPELVATPPYDLLCAAWYFSDRGIWRICDRGVDIATVTTVTEKINGGVNGLQVRYGNTQKVYNALSS